VPKDELDRLKEYVTDHHALHLASLSRGFSACGVACAVRAVSPANTGISMAISRFFKDKKLNITSVEEEVDELEAFGMDDDEDDAYTRRMKAEARRNGTLPLAGRGLETRLKRMATYQRVVWWHSRCR
jgi:hypothetical protein